MFNFGIPMWVERGGGGGGGGQVGRASVMFEEEKIPKWCFSCMFHVLFQDYTERNN